MGSQPVIHQKTKHYVEKQDEQNWYDRNDRHFWNIEYLVKDLYQKASKY